MQLNVFATGRALAGGAGGGGSIVVGLAAVCVVAVVAGCEPGGTVSSWPDSSDGPIAVEPGPATSRTTSVDTRSDSSLGVGERSSRDEALRVFLTRNPAAAGLRPEDLPYALKPSKRNGRSTPAVLFKRPAGEDVEYVLIDRHTTLHFGHSGFRIKSSGGAAPFSAALEFVDGRAARIEPALELPGKMNLFAGDRETWVSGLSTFRRLIYHDVWPGIDVVYDLRDGGVEYTLLVAAGADVSRARFRYVGTDGVSLSPSGDLRIISMAGVLSESAPVAFQGQSEKIQSVSVAYRLFGTNEFGFHVGAYEHDSALVIDPTLNYSSFLGSPGTAEWGTGTDIVWSSWMGSDGSHYLTGCTLGIYPTTPGAYDGTQDLEEDVFVAHVSSDGATLLWATLLGGGALDCGTDIEANAAGVVTVAGGTRSSDFPVTAGVHSTLHSGASDGAQILDGFVAQLSSNGATLLWSSFVGGTKDDFVLTMTLDADGNPTIAGSTTSPDFPTTGSAFDKLYAGKNEAFVSRFAANGSRLLWSTFIGGDGTEEVADLDIDADGTIVAVGIVEKYIPIDDPGGGGGPVLSLTGDVAPPPINIEKPAPADVFPTTPRAFDIVPNGGTDVFVLRLSATGSTLIWSTYLGGASEDHAFAVAIGSSGKITIGGYTASNDFATTPGAFDRTLGGADDGFVSRLSPDGSTLIWSTYLGGSGGEGVYDVDVDASGNVAATGETNSTNFPTTVGAYDTSANGSADAFVTRLSQDGASLEWSTYLGGAAYDSGWHVELVEDGTIWVMGDTSSATFPDVGAGLMAAPTNSLDTFIVRFGNPNSTAPVPFSLFDNQRLPSAAPGFVFSSSAAEKGGLDYEIQWDASRALSGVDLVTRTSRADPGFSNLDTPGDITPFNSGDRVEFTIQGSDSLNNGSSFWWRVRSITADGNVAGYWSQPRSFTTDGGLPIDWFQTTDAQFRTNWHGATEVGGAGSVVMASLPGDSTTAAKSPSILVDATLINAHNIYVSDNVYVRSPESNVSAFAEYAFGDMGIPADAVIDGIEVAVESAKVGPRTVAASVRLSGDGGISYSAPYSAVAAETSAYSTFGGVADSWGQGWTGASFVDGSLRARVDVDITGGGGATEGRVDHLWLKVYYHSDTPRRVVSSLISLADFPGAAGWSTYQWSQGSPGQLSVDVLDAADNPIGTTGTTTGVGVGVVDISNVDPIAFPALKLRATFDAPSDLSTSLLDWSVQPRASGNVSPVADAGTSQVVNEGELVALDASGSTDADGDFLTYSWSQTGGATVVLSGATTSAPSFEAPSVAVANTLTFSLTVSDGSADSAPVDVQITVNNWVNDAPLAIVGPAQSLGESLPVTLDGSSSTDPNGDPLTYLWQQISGPDAGVTGQTSATPAFTLATVTADVTLVFELVVNDGLVDSLPASVAVTVLNTVNEPPVASAGADQSVGEGSGVTVVLAGTGDDPNGASLVYTWTQISGPNVVLVGADTASANFPAPDVTGDTALVFALQVSDGQDSSVLSLTTVTVTNSINEAPTADAGPAQTVGEGIVVTLVGAGSDPNGDALSFQWAQVGSPAVVFSDPIASTVTFTSPQVTSPVALTFTLLVNDGAVDSALSTVVVTIGNDVNEAPTADAGSAQTVAEGSAVTLDGRGSSDPNGDVVTYLWSQSGGPAVVLSDSASDIPSFQAPAVSATSNLEFSLVVTDALGMPSAPAVVNITVSDGANSIPVAVVTATPTSAGEMVSVTLDGSGSADADGDSLSYIWTQRGTPGVVLASPNSAITTFVAPVVVGDSVLVFDLTVHDGQVGSTAATVNIPVLNTVNERPVALAGDDRTAAENANYTLDGSASHDPNGDDLTFAWTQTSGPSVTFDASSATPTFLAPEVFAGTVLEFALVVHDGRDASADSVEARVAITVANSVNEAPSANAGVNQVLDEGAGGALTGLASSDPNSDSLTYLWTQTGGPLVALDMLAPSQPSFTAPTVVSDEELSFQLVVNDGSVDSAPAFVTITIQNTTNESPTADAGGDQNVAEDSDVTLSALGSFDPNGDSMSYEWRQSQGPLVTLTGTSEPTLIFRAPSVSATTPLEFELTVSDGKGGVAADLVLVTVGNTTNAMPVADPGLDQWVDEGALVVLDGGASTDSDGDALAYSWMQVSGPTATLDDSSLASPSFVARFWG